MTVHAVYDTVTLLQAAANPAGPAGGCLRLVAEGRVTLHMGGDGLAELSDVLGRAKVRKRLPQLTDEGVATFLTGLRVLAHMAGNVPAIFQYDRDPDDEHILNLAILTGSRFIVTRDNDLLDLMAEGNAEGIALKAIHPSLTILNPLAFLVAVNPPAPTADCLDPPGNADE